MLAGPPEAPVCAAKNNSTPATVEPSTRPASHAHRGARNPSTAADASRTSKVTFSASSEVPIRSTVARIPTATARLSG